MNKRIKSKKNKLTINQQQFQKEAKRVNRIIEKAESQGKSVPKKIKSLVKQPSRITSSRIEKLKSVKSSTVSKTKAKRQPKKRTKNQAAFRKEVNRIKRQISRLENKGMIVPASVKDKLSMPGRVTQKKIEELKALTGKSISEQSYTTDKKTGELLPAKGVLAKERSERSRRGWETRRRNEENQKNISPERQTEAQAEIIPEIQSEIQPPTQIDPEIKTNFEPMETMEFYQSVIDNIISQLDGRSAEADKLAADRNRRSAANFKLAVDSSISIIIRHIQAAIDSRGIEAVAQAFLDLTLPIPTVKELYYGEIETYLSDFENALARQGIISEQERMKFYATKEEDESWGEPM